MLPLTHSPEILPHSRWAGLLCPWVSPVLSCPLGKAFPGMEMRNGSVPQNTASAFSIVTKEALGAPRALFCFILLLG